MFVCENCGNKDERYIGYKNGEPYCRRCIKFVGDKAKIISVDKNARLELDYSLSSLQQDISNKTLQAIINKKNVLIHAVCGAGKTELVFSSIEYCLKNGMQVGFAIPRRDVVIDLYPRIKNAFKNCRVTPVYGGNTDILEGDIIILTTHQLFRYEKYFDLLIIDETDAFPFQGDETLEYFFNKSIKGNYIMLSATPLKRMIEKVKNENGVVLSLLKRYHGHPLPVPIIKNAPFINFFILIFYMHKFIKNKKPFLVFVPTIDECEILFSKVSLLFRNGCNVHSKKHERAQIIDKFKNRLFDFLITTSVLERGVTIKDLQVIVYKAHHDIYDSKTLIQISGRVGRKIDAYDGEVIFISEYITMAMKEAINDVKRANGC